MKYATETEKFKMKENKTLFIHLKEFVCKITTNRGQMLYYHYSMSLFLSHWKVHILSHNAYECPILPGSISNNILHKMVKSSKTQEDKENETYK